MHTRQSTHGWESLATSGRWKQRPPQLPGFGVLQQNQSTALVGCLAYTPFGVLRSGKLWAKLLSGKEEIVVDTMTYASVAVLPWSIAKDRTYPVLPEVEFIGLDFSMIKR